MRHNLHNVKMKNRGCTSGLALPPNRPSQVANKLHKHDRTVLFNPSSRWDICYLGANH